MLVILFVIALCSNLNADPLDVENIKRGSRQFYSQNLSEIKKRCTEACHDYYRTLLFLGFSIKTTDDTAQKTFLENLLFGMLHTGGHWGFSQTEKSNSVSSQIFERAAYGIFIAHSELEPQNNHTTTTLLQTLKKAATPQAANKNVSYIPNQPEDDRFRR